MQPQAPPNMRHCVMTFHFVLPWETAEATVAALVVHYPVAAKPAYRCTTAYCATATLSCANLADVAAAHGDGTGHVPTTVRCSIYAPAGDSFMRACTPVNLFAAETYRALNAAYHQLPPHPSVRVCVQHARRGLAHLASKGTWPMAAALMGSATIPVAQYVSVLVQLFVHADPANVFFVRHVIWIPETETLLLGVTGAATRPGSRIVQLALGPRGLALQWPTFEYHAESGFLTDAHRAEGAPTTPSVCLAYECWKNSPLRAPGQTIFPLTGPLADLLVPPLRAPVSFNFLWGDSERATREEAERTEALALRYWDEA